MSRFFQSLKTVFIPRVGTFVRRSRWMEGGAEIVEYTLPTRATRVDQAHVAPAAEAEKATVLSSESRS